MNQYIVTYDNNYDGYGRSGFIAHAFAPEYEEWFEFIKKQNSRSYNGSQIVDDAWIKEKEDSVLLDVFKVDFPNQIQDFWLGNSSGSFRTMLDKSIDRGRFPLKEAIEAGLSPREVQRLVKSEDQNHFVGQVQRALAGENKMSSVADFKRIQDASDTIEKWGDVFLAWEIGEGLRRENALFLGENLDLLESIPEEVFRLMCALGRYGEGGESRFLENNILMYERGYITTLLDYSDFTEAALNRGWGHYYFRRAIDEDLIEAFDMGIRAHLSFDDVIAGHDFR